MSDVPNIDELKKAEKSGVSFWVHAPTGHWQISAEDVVRLSENADAFFADGYGVEREKFLVWLAWHEASWPCHGTTRTGSQCQLRGQGRKDGTYLDPRKFRPGISDRCEHHQEL